MIGKVFIVTIFISSAAASISPNVAGNFTLASYEDAPWMVSLQMYQNDHAFCGAALIKSEDKSSDSTSCIGWVITAASCLKGIPEGIIVTLGNIKLEEEDDRELNLQIVNNHTNDKNETGTKYANDLALLQVTFDLKTNSNYTDTDTCETIPFLQTTPNHKFNETFFVSMNASIFGWGLIVDNGPLQKELYTTPIPLLTHIECYDLIGHNNYTLTTMICAGGAQFSPNSYDTGGPMVCSYEIEEDDKEGKKVLNQYEYLCGVTSVGPTKPGTTQRLPTIFMDVAGKYFADWINKIINPSSTTEKEADTGSHDEYRE